MRTVLTILATLTVLAAIGACTSTPPATSSAPGVLCVPLTDTELSGIEQGLLDQGMVLTQGYRLPLPVELHGGGLTQIVAVAILADGIDEQPAVLAIGDQVGPVAAIDHVAREFFDWGAATQPGSPAAAVRDAIATRAHADQVRSCIVA